MLKWWVVGLTLVTAPALAQRMGGRSGGPPPPRPSPMTAEEAARAATAREWAAEIEKGRASAPPPPLPKIRYPTDSDKLFNRLRMVEDQHKELAQFLDKLWKDAKELQAQRSALDGLWRDAETTKWKPPRWVRPAIDEFYAKHANGQALHPPEAADATKPSEAAKPAEAAAPPAAR